jgi:hypothetical protein
MPLLMLAVAWRVPHRLPTAQQLACLRITGDVPTAAARLTADRTASALPAVGGR